MSETVISSSSNSTEKAIDEYYDTTSDSGSSDSSHSSEGSSMDKGYTSSVLGLPLEVIQEQLRKASVPKLAPRLVSLHLILWTKRRPFIVVL